MADSCTPLDRDAVAAILADYIVLGTHVAVESAIDEATDRIVDLVGRGARDRARRAEHPLTVEQAPRLGWWGEAIDVDGEPTVGLERSVLVPWRDGGRLTFTIPQRRGNEFAKIAAVKFYRAATDVEAAAWLVLDHPVAVPGADCCMIDVSPVREAQ